LKFRPSRCFEVTAGKALQLHGKILTLSAQCHQNQQLIDRREIGIGLAPIYSTFVKGLSFTNAYLPLALIWINFFPRLPEAEAGYEPQ
jgi:hypothetical protein